MPNTTASTAAAASSDWPVRDPPPVSALTPKDDRSPPDSLPDSSVASLRESFGAFRFGMPMLGFLMLGFFMRAGQLPVPLWCG